MSRRRYIFFLVPVCFIFFSVPRPVQAQRQDSLISPALHKDHEEIAGTKEISNTGEMIIEHILDAHEWHLFSLNKKEVVIPLPVILFYHGHLYAFSSARFHHGEQPYKGFKLETEGKNKGKIVCTGNPGTAEAGEQTEKPLDLSITKDVMSLFISVIILCVLFISVGRAYQKRKDEAPRGFQSFIEPVILFVRELAISSIGEKKYEKYLPYLLTLFFFIFFNNLFGLMPFFPGGANLTGNITVTMVMAIFTFIITTFSGNRNYWLDIFNTPGVPWWLKVPVPLMPIVEIIGVFTKPFILMIRLFANIAAGHIVVFGFISLIFIFANMHIGLGYSVSVVSVLFAVFMGLLEMLVAFIQAYVFTLLSALYFGMATQEHH